jgi:hypothetical protein
VPNKATVVGSTTCVHDQVPTLCYNPSTEGTEKVVTGIVGAKSTLTVTVGAGTTSERRVAGHDAARRPSGRDLELPLELLERGTGPVVLGDVVEALVERDVKDVGGTDVLFDRDPAEAQLGRRVEAVLQPHYLVAQLFVTLPSDPTHQRVLASVG